jgi:hypothetical protein
MDIFLNCITPLFTFIFSQITNGFIMLTSNLLGQIFLGMTLVIIVIGIILSVISHLKN